MPRARQRRLAAVIAILIFPVITAAVIAEYGVDLPFWDEWDITELVDRVSRNEASVRDYLTPHGPHRIVALKVFLSRVIVLTRWNVRMELWISFFLAALTFAAFARLSWRTLEGPSRLLAITASSAIIFSLSQFENWLWGWEFSWFLANAACAIAILVLSSSRWHFWIRFLVAAALCTLGSFTIGSGMSSWVASLPLVAVDPIKFRIRKGPLVAWLLAAAVCIFLYFNLPPSIVGGTLGSASSVHAGHLLQFFVTVSGSFWAGPIPALILGTTAVALLVHYARRAWRIRLGAALPWLAAGLYTLVFAALVSWVRTPLGAGAAEVSRYATPALFLVIAVVHLIALMDSNHGRTVLLVVLGLVVFADLAVWPRVRDTAKRRRVNKICVDLHFLLQRGDCLLAVSGEPDLEKRLALARASNFRDFAGPSSFREQSYPGGIDAMRRQRGGYAVSGWMKESRDPAGVVLTAGPERSVVGLTIHEGGGAWNADIATDRLAAGQDQVLSAWRYDVRREVLEPLGSISLR